MSFTVEDVYIEVHRIARENPNNVDSMPDHSCRYIGSDRKPSCIFGHALVNLGCDIESLQEFDANYLLIDDVLARICNLGESAWEAALIREMIYIQQLQDRGKTWGYAIDDTIPPPL